MTGRALIYADWLAEKWRPGTAEFIRVQCALAAHLGSDPAYSENLQARSRRLLVPTLQRWQGEYLARRFYFGAGSSSILAVCTGGPHLLVRHVPRRSALPPSRPVGDRQENGIGWRRPASRIGSLKGVMRIDGGFARTSRRPGLLPLTYPQGASAIGNPGIPWTQQAWQRSLAQVLPALRPGRRCSGSGIQDCLCPTAWSASGAIR